MNKATLFIFLLLLIGIFNACSNLEGDKDQKSNNNLNTNLNKSCQIIEFEKTISQKCVLDRINPNYNMLFADYIRQYDIPIPDSSFENQMLFSSNQPYNLLCYDTAIRLIQMPYFNPSQLLLLTSSEYLGKYCIDCTHILMDGSYPGGGRPFFNLTHHDTTLDFNQIINIIEESDYWNDSLSFIPDTKSECYDGLKYRIEIKIGSKSKVISFLKCTKLATELKKEINYFDSISRSVRKIGRQHLNYFD